MRILKVFLFTNKLSSRLAENILLKRILSIKNLSDPILLCNEEHRFIVAEQMRELSVKPSSILLEPFGRNTAPAITIAALKAQSSGEDPIIIVLSSDHEILNKKNFLHSINLGLTQAMQNKLVTFGIIPSSPETGYGYIKSDKPLNINNEGSNIKEFIEKPNLETTPIDPGDIENEIVSKEIDENIGLNDDSLIDEEITLEDDLQDDDVENIIDIDNENKDSDN